MPQSPPPGRGAAARAAGFSLVEVLCSLVVLGVGITGIIEGVSIALGSSKEAERHTVAARLAAGRIEELRAEGWLSEGEEEGDFGEEFPLYAYRQTVERTAIDGLYEVSLAVNLTEGDQEVLELKTMLFQAPYLDTLGTSTQGAGAAGRQGAEGAGGRGGRYDRAGSRSREGRAP